MSTKAWATALALALATTPLGLAQANETFAGKTIHMIVGVGAGGGFDIYSRTIARHLTQFIPGKPNIVVENMPGAGGGKAATYMASIAPKNGTTIASLMPGTIVNPLLMGQRVAYDATKFVYLGSADSGTRLCVSTQKSGRSDFKDMMSKQIVVGAIAAGSSTYDYAQLVKNLAGAQFKIVTGYTSTREITLAMDRGEADAVCGWDWSSLRSQQPDYAKKYFLFLQTAATAERKLKDIDAPELRQFLKSENDTKIADLVFAQQIFGRPYVAPPGTPESITRILRSAFDQTMADKSFLADAAKTKLAINPATGSAVQEAVMRVYTTPPAIIERAKKVMK